MNRSILVFALTAILLAVACGGRLSTLAATDSRADAGSTGSHAGANARDAGVDGGWCQGGPALCGTGYPQLCTWPEVCRSTDRAATAERCEGGLLAFSIVETETWEVYYYSASTGQLVGYSDRDVPRSAACFGPTSFVPPTMCTPDPSACGAADAGDGGG